MSINPVSPNIVSSALVTPGLLGGVGLKATSPAATSPAATSSVLSGTLAKAAAGVGSALPKQGSMATDAMHLAGLKEGFLHSQLGLERGPTLSTKLRRKQLMSRYPSLANRLRDNGMTAIPYAGAQGAEAPEPGVHGTRHGHRGHRRHRYGRRHRRHGAGRRHRGHGRHRTGRAWRGFLNDPRLSLNDKIELFLMMVIRKNEKKIEDLMRKYTGQDGRAGSSRRRGRRGGSSARGGRRASQRDMARKVGSVAVNIASKVGAVVASIYGTPAAGAAVAGLGSAAAGAIAGSGSSKGSASGDSSTSNETNEKKLLYDIQKLESHVTNMFSVFSTRLKKQNDLMALFTRNML